LTIVGHSLGGAIVLRLAGAPELRGEFADVLDLVDRVVLMAALDFSVEKADPAVVEIVGLGKTKVGLAKLFGILRGKAAKFTLDAYADPGAATREAAHKMIGVLKKRDNRRPAQAQLEQAVPFDLKERKPDWERIESLVEDYRNVRFPCLIVWGTRDETLPLSMGYKLQAQLPDARLVVMHNTKHSMQLERPRLSAAVVREFIASGTRGRARVREIRPEATRLIDNDTMALVLKVQTGR
jgi:pimeloyl-ACP methyl ester carboxylesterase